MVDKPEQDNWRLRAAGIGFVVMDSPKATSQILHDGPEHVVNGVSVNVYMFTRRNCPEYRNKAFVSNCNETMPDGAMHQVPSVGASNASVEQAEQWAVSAAFFHKKCELMTCHDTKDVEAVLSQSDSK